MAAKDIESSKWWSFCYQMLSAECIDTSTVYLLKNKTDDYGSDWWKTRKSPNFDTKKLSCHLEWTICVTV